ncbi:hypothetical protein J416_09339 [Gracilibacillus halophilus YIM-C55.5]|uniref:Uncharacterized protein n=1 Tax=Gracilibacillus halophilus YIM-C55.5 TaxID=1308866 RepID=N4WQF7_9BACI|nr:hypothetical protein [Gracilibacillus halophilus]ENH96690.1 hypothetical protein J416_09339 [Gracilibacillus halophilus YIM-C55.5]
MKMGDMAKYTDRLNETMQIKDKQLRNDRLANLQSDLEAAYEIPLTGDALKFRIENPGVIELYRTVVEARSV